MKVREVITKLMEDYTLDEELVIAWWDKYLIEKYLTDDPMFPVNISDKDWSVVCENMADLTDRANSEVVDAIEDQYGAIAHERYYSR
jgi:hypothetical protein